MRSSQSNHIDNVVSILLTGGNQSWSTLRTIENLRSKLCIDSNDIDGYLHKFECNIDPNILEYMNSAGLCILESLQTSSKELVECDLVLDSLSNLGYLSRSLSAIEMYRMSALVILKPWLTYLVYTDPGI